MPPLNKEGPSPDEPHHHLAQEAGEGHQVVIDSEYHQKLGWIKPIIYSETFQ